VTRNPYLEPEPPTNFLLRHRPLGRWPPKMRDAAPAVGQTSVPVQNVSQIRSAASEEMRPE